VIHATNHRRLRLAGFRTRTVPTAHGPLQVYDAKGSPTGPTVVLIHGVSTRASTWAGVATALLPHCRRMVIPDLLGHGESFVPPGGLCVHNLHASLTTTLDDIVPEPMVVVGNSMGALMAGLFVAERAWRVRGLFLSNPGGAPIEPEVFHRAVRLLTPSTHTEALRLAKAGSSFSSPFVHQLGARNVLRNLSQPHIRRFLQTATPEDSLTAEQVSRFDMPVLLLTGRDDGVIPDETIQWYRDHLPPHARIREIERFGHAPMTERPRDLARYIREFLSELDPSVFGTELRAAR